jgi:hypothetical protein
VVITRFTGLSHEGLGGCVVLGVKVQDELEQDQVQFCVELDCVESTWTVLRAFLNSPHTFFYTVTRILYCYLSTNILFG